VLVGIGQNGEDRVGRGVDDLGGRDLLDFHVMGYPPKGATKPKRVFEKIN